MTSGKSIAVRWSIGLLLVVGAVSALWALFPADEWLTSLVFQIDDLGLIGLVVYLGLYVLLAVLGFPATPLNIGAGVIFAFLYGYPLALIGGATVATISFLFARYIATDWIRSRLDKLEHFDEISEMVAEEGLKIVILARLSPLIPATVKNYGFAVTDIKARTYVLGTVIGQIPIYAVHVYLGWVGGIAMMSGGPSGGPMQWLLIGGGLLASAALVAVLTWYARRKLERHA